jgi:hypothetical protein
MATSKATASKSGLYADPREDWLALRQDLSQGVRLSRAVATPGQSQASSPHAARTVFKNLPTSNFSRLLSRDSDCAAERT